jgi:hypothetical protein
MADYQSFPLWVVAGSGPENVDPRSLPISEELVSQLLAWARDYDSTLNDDDPTQSGFSSSDAEAKFKDSGRALAAALQSELGASFVVEYRH